MGSHIMSHIEFGGCLADYPSLKARYNKIRALEDVDEVQALAQGHPASAHARVRFVNYYTLSSGRPKPPKSPSDNEIESLQPTPSIATTTVASPTEAAAADDPPPYSAVDRHPSTPGLLDEKIAKANDNADDQEPSRSSEEDLSAEQRMSMFHLDPSPMAADEDEPEIHTPSQKIDQVDQEPEPDLPPIPEEPVAPELPDLSQYSDKDTRKQIEKESKRLQKAYEQAVKNRDKAIREREKIIESRQKRKQKETRRAEKQTQKEMEKLQKSEKKRLEREESAASKASAAESAEPAATDERDKAKKLRRFCSLPSKNNGVRDETWVDVYMQGVDEVGAHCGLFFPGEHYERLIGDVGGRVQNWVHEDMSKRLALEHEA